MNHYMYVYVCVCVFVNVCSMGMFRNVSLVHEMMVYQLYMWTNLWRKEDINHNTNPMGFIVHY
jgi:hypothetical protein